MTIRAFPLPLSEHCLQLETVVDDRYIAVSTLRRTDEFMVQVKWWDMINYPMVLNVARVDQYIQQLSDGRDVFCEFYAVVDKPLGILAEYDSDGHIKLSQFCGVVIGKPLTLTTHQLKSHIKQVREIAQFLNTASDNESYEAVQA